jgi:hypothetical protein
VKDTARLLRDRDFSARRKAYYLVVGPLYHLQKWRGVRRGARAELPVPAVPATPVRSVPAAPGSSQHSGEGRTA